MTQTDQDHATKERILDEAEILFAQRGYRDVTIREITAAARCNQAAVNYHFGGKQNLYLEVFRARWGPRAKRLRDYFEESLAGHDSPSPAVVVHALASAFLEGPLTEEEKHRHHQLMTRELAQPTEAFELVAHEVHQPFLGDLVEKFRSSIRVPVDEERLILCIVSIMAMVLHFNFARPMITHITGGAYDEDFKSRLVKHITDFSIHGLGICEKGAES